MQRTVTRYTGVYQRESLTRLFNGRQDVCYDITYKTGSKKAWEKVGWASEGYSAKLAFQIRSERLRSIRHGEQLPKQKENVPYFKDVALKYLEWAKTNKSRGGRDDEFRYKKHLSPAFDGKRLNEISALDLERLKVGLSKKGLSPATVKHCLVLFRQIVNKAIAWKIYSGENPIKQVKLPTLHNQRQRFLSHQEAKALLAELKKRSAQLHDIALISVHCGLRAGEIFNLKKQDLDFRNELINVADPKNKETRKAFMTNTVKKMLLERVPEKPDELIFKDRQNGVQIESISKSFKRAVDELKLNEGIIDPRQAITFHSLRHTFASWLALQGETLLTIRDLLGHKTLTMTMRYAHLIPDHKRRAALDLEENFEKSRDRKERGSDVT